MYRLTLHLDEHDGAQDRARERLEANRGIMYSLDLRSIQEQGGITTFTWEVDDEEQALCLGANVTHICDWTPSVQRIEDVSYAQLKEILTGISGS